LDAYRIDLDEDDYGHWSFLPITHPALPDVDDTWILNPIDAFVLHKLREVGLTPSPPADDRTWVRRVYFDLIGLPPAPEEVDARPGATGETEPAADPGPEVGLDKLLRLPNSFEADIDRRGGATASEWRLRFDKARGGVDEAKEKLVKAEKELDQISGSSTSWQVSAPGASDPQTSPLSLRLRQEVKAHRAEIEQAERELRSLDVAADLAAVPTEWRE
jgi:hypothetical protein